MGVRRGGEFPSFDSTRQVKVDEGESAEPQERQLMNEGNGVRTSSKLPLNLDCPEHH